MDVATKSLINKIVEKRNEYLACGLIRISGFTEWDSNDIDPKTDGLFRKIGNSFLLYFGSGQHTIPYKLG